MLNRLFYVIALSMLALNLVGCTKPVVPTDLVSKIEQKLTEHSNLGFVALFDSDNKKTTFLARESQPDKEVENEFYLRPKKIYENALEDNASEIKELSNITVLGLSGVKIKDSLYDYCKYITVDNQNRPDLAELICKLDENQEQEKANLSLKSLKVLDPKFVTALGEIAEIDNIGLVVFNDYKTGQPKLFLGKDNYFTPEVTVSFPLLLAKDTKEKDEKMTITYRKNPCKSCTISGGKVECTYVKDSSC